MNLNKWLEDVSQRLEKGPPHKRIFVDLESWGWLMEMLNTSRPTAIHAWSCDSLESEPRRLELVDADCASSDLALAVKVIREMAQAHRCEFGSDCTGCHDCKTLQSIDALVNVPTETKGE